MNNKREHPWYFTFGPGHKHYGKYVVIYGSFMETRNTMIHRFGHHWLAQHKTPEGAEIKEKGLRRI